MVRLIVSRTRCAASVFFVIVLGAVGTTKADFTFGEPNNLGAIVNSQYDEVFPNLSADGLSFYFSTWSSGDIWVTTRATVSDPWGPPENLGPPINTSADDGSTCVSGDGLALYLGSNRPGGHGDPDLWVATRATTDDPWGEPNNLGATVNSEYKEFFPSLSADGLSLYFAEGTTSFRPEGIGGGDLWVTTRATVSDPWGPPENLGPAVNSFAYDGAPSISSDGRVLFFQSNRSGGYDIWMTMRASTEDDWEPAVKLESPVNTPTGDANPNVSVEGSTLYFSSNRDGGQGGWDLYQVPIVPIADLSGGRGDIVDCEDVCIMLEHWGTDDPLCDIGPMPWGDGIVDVQDLIVLTEYLTTDVNDVNDAG